ncbi:hypothetical protein D3C86_1158630 [compost metagenome]
MSARLPVSVRLAVLAPMTVTPGTVAPRNNVPWVTVRMTLIARSLRFGSRSASRSATLMPPIFSTTSSWPFCVPGRVLTGASLSST